MQEQAKLSTVAAVTLGLALGSLYGSNVAPDRTVGHGKNRKPNPDKKKKRKAAKKARRKNRRK